MNEDLNDLLALLPSGVFKDTNELNDFIQSQGLNEVYALMPEGVFRDEQEFMSYTSSIGVGKKKEGALLSTSLEGDVDLSTQEEEEQYLLGASSDDEFDKKAEKARSIRKTSRLNPDGSPSTVLMESGEADGKFIAYPTLFPKDPNNYNRDPETWMELDSDAAFEEAKKRGEVFFFDTDQEAKEFAKGSWKKKDFESEYFKQVDEMLKKSKDPFYGTFLQEDFDYEKEFDRRLESVTPQLINKEESYVVPEMIYRFKDYGFDFEQTGVGDAMRVKAKNKKSIIINLDPFTLGKEEKNAEKLKKFLAENKVESEALKKASNLTNQIAKKERLVKDEQEYKNTIKLFKKEEEDFKEFATEVAINKMQLEQKIKDFNALSPEQKQSPAAQELLFDIEEQIKKVTQDNLEVVDKFDDLSKKGKELDKITAKYTAMKAEQGSVFFGGAGINSILSGIENILEANMGRFVDRLAEGKYDKYEEGGIEAFTGLTPYDISDLMNQYAKKEIEGNFSKYDFSRVEGLGESPSKEEVMSFLRGLPSDYEEAKAELNKIDIKGTDVRGSGMRTGYATGGIPVVSAGDQLIGSRQKTLGDEADFWVRDGIKKYIKYYGVDYDEKYGETGLKPAKIAIEKYIDKGTMRLDPSIFSGTASAYSEGGLIDMVDNSIVKAIGSKDATEQYIDMAKEDFWAGAYLGLLESGPAMGLTLVNPMAGTAAIFAQSTAMVDEEMRNNPAFDNISEKEKFRVQAPIGLAVATLEKVGLSNIIKQKGLLNGLVAKALGKATSETTGKGFQEIIQQEVDSAIARGLLTIGAGGLAEFETGFLQELATIGIEEIYDLSKEKNMFDNPNTFKGVMAESLYAGLQEGVGGGMMAGYGAVVNATWKGQMATIDTETYKLFEAMINDDTYADIYLAKLEQQEINGEITAEEKKKQEDAVNQIRGIINKIPEDISVEDRKKSLELEYEKQILLNQVDGKIKELSQRKQDRINRIDKELDGIKEVAPTEVAPTEAAPTEAAPTEAAPTEAAPTEAAPTPKRKLDISGLVELGKNFFRSEGKDQTPRSDDDIDRVTKVTDRARKAIASIANILPNTNIVLHDTQDSYEAATGKRGRGGFDRNINTIHINLDKATETTVAHEVFHAVLFNKLGADVELQGNLKQMVASVAKVVNRRSELGRHLDKFIKGYERDVEGMSQESAEAFLNEERLSELMGMLSANYDQLNKPQKNAVIEFIKKVAAKFGIEIGTEFTKTDEAVIDFLNVMSDRISYGEEITETDIELLDNGTNPIGTPTQIELPIKEQVDKLPTINFKDNYKYSLIDSSKSMDIEALIEDIHSKKEKVWFWVADQLGLDAELGIDAGPSFAFSTEGDIWASGMPMKDLLNRINESSYIFIISGSPQKSHMFNKAVFDVYTESLGDYQTFKDAVIGVATKKVREVLEAHDSWESLRDDPSGDFKPSKKAAREKLQSQGIKKPTSAQVEAYRTENERIGTGRKKFLLEHNLSGTKPSSKYHKAVLALGKEFVDPDSMRDGFFVENDFQQNDIMLVLKPTGAREGSNHSTYANTIEGEVIGVPDKKIDAAEIMPKETREKIEGKSRAKQSQSIAPYGVGVREVAPRDIREQIDEELSKASGGTQVTNTESSYEKVAEMLKLRGITGNILDFGAGLGLGTDAMSEILGGTVESFEINTEGWRGKKPPTYTSLSEIDPDKKYDAIVSLNVLNVVPKDIRDGVVKEIFDRLEDGGVAYISARGFRGDVDQGTPIAPSIEPKSIFVRKNGKKTFQKGFDRNELVEYIQDILGDKVTVIKATSDLKNKNPKFDRIKFGNNSVIVTKEPSGIREQKDVESRAGEFGKFKDEYKKVIARIEQAVAKMKGEGKTKQEMEKRVLSSLKRTKIYKGLDDVLREELIRDAKKKVGVRIKSAPSVAKLFGDIDDVKKITLTEKQLLLNRLIALSQGAKGAVRELNKIRKEIADSIKDLKGKGKISARQLTSVISRLSKLNLENEAKVEEFIEYMANVFAKSEYQSTLAEANKMIPKAKTNVRRGKLGMLDGGLFEDLIKLLTVKSRLIPTKVLNSYVSILNQLSKGAILEAEARTSLSLRVEKVLGAIREEQELIPELSLRFIGSKNLVMKDGKIDFAASINQMLKKEEITKEEADLMRKYKKEIMPPEVREGMSEEDVNKKKKEYTKSALNTKSKLLDGKIDLPNRLERDAARKLLKLLTEGKLMNMELNELKNLVKLLNNIENGYFPYYGQLLLEKLQAIEDVDAPLSVIMASKMLPISKFFAKIEQFATSFFNKGGTYVDKMIKNNPNFYIDQLFGDFKTKRLFNSLFKKIAEGVSNVKTELSGVGEQIQKAQTSVEASFKRNPNKIMMSMFKQMAYLLQLEYNNNPEHRDSKQVNQASEVFKATIAAIKQKNTVYGSTDKEVNRVVKMLEEILEKFSDDTGEIDVDKLMRSFNSAEKLSINTIAKINKGLTKKALFTATVLRGKRVPTFASYVHHRVLAGRGKNTYKDESAALKGYSDSIQPSTKAKTLIEREGTVEPLLLDPYSTTYRGAKMTLMDFYLTSPIRVARRTMAALAKKLENVDMNGTQIDVFNALDGAVETVIKQVIADTANLTSQTENILNSIARTGYRAMLGRVSKLVIESASNLLNAMVVDPIAFVIGLGSWSTKQMVQLPQVMRNLNSTQTSTLFSGNTLSGRMVDISINADKAQRGRVTPYSQVGNAVALIYNQTAKRAKNVTESTADFMISSPDKISTIPMWQGSFIKKFYELTKTKPDLEKIAANDEVYMNKYEQQLKEATAFADSNSAFVGASGNVALNAMKLNKDIGEAAASNLYKLYNNFLSRFLIWEWTAARTGIGLAMQAGKIERRRGVALLAATVLRMTTYNLLMRRFGDLLAELLFGDDEEEKKPLSKALGQAAVQTANDMIFGRNFGNVARSLINIGVEKFNQNTLDFLREGEYDAYEDAVAYSIFLQDPNDYKREGVGDIMVKMAGPFTPLVKTLDLGIKVAKAEPKKDPAAIRRQRLEKTLRLPVEIGGHLGVLPFYADNRKIVLEYIYRDMDKSGGRGGFEEMIKNLKRIDPKTAKEFEKAGKDIGIIKSNKKKK